MAIDIADMLYMDEKKRQPGDELPIKYLFRAIQERWSVVPIGEGAVPSGRITPSTSGDRMYPLDYDRCPTTWDRLDAIRRNIVALAPHFIDTNVQQSRFYHWLRFPRTFSEAEIAKQDARVLKLPTRGATYTTVEEAKLYEDFLFSAASWLSKFRVVNAGNYTSYKTTLDRYISGHFQEPGEFYLMVFPLDSRTECDPDGDNWKLSINGTESTGHADTTGSSFGPTTAFLARQAGAQYGADCVATEEDDPVFVQESGILVRARAEVSIDGIGFWYSNDRWEDPMRYGRQTSFSYNISNIPASIRIANASGYQCEAKLAFAAQEYASNDKRAESKRPARTMVTVTLDNGTWKATVVVERNYDGTWLETRRDEYERGRDYTQPNIHRWTERAYRPDGSHEMIVDTGSETTSSWQFDEKREFLMSMPHVETLAKLMHREDGDYESESDHFLSLGVLAAREVAEEILGDKISKKLLCIPDCDPSVLFAAALNFAEIDPDPNFGFRDVNLGSTADAISQIPTSGEVGCRIVPIFDYGPAYKVGDDDELENWAGLSEEDWEDLHSQEEES